MIQTILTGNTQQQLAVSGTAAETPILLGGRYDIWATVDVHVKTGAVVSGVTTSNGYLIRAGETLAGVEIEDRCKIGAISIVAGTLSYYKVG